MANEENTSVRIAELLGRLTDGIEADGLERTAAADFVLRCSFLMFLGGIGLIPRSAVSAAARTGALDQLWTATVYVLALKEAGDFYRQEMGSGALDDAGADVLCEADSYAWRDIDLSIFGSLIEGSLEAKERHRLCAHYTPRSYVQRLVTPTIEQPLRSEWEIVGGMSRLMREPPPEFAPHYTPEESLEWLAAFQRKLAATRVLDPACGTGNFLIVALETLYLIEDEVLAEFAARGAEPPAERVSPRTMLGIEINPRACTVCRLVLQLCELRRRCQVQVGSDAVGLAACDGIECRDALLAYDAKEVVADGP